MTNDTTQTDTSTSTPLTAADLLAPAELKEYKVKALNDRPVWIRDVPAGAMLEFMMIDEESNERNDALMALIAASVVDENACPVFDQAQPQMLKSMPMAVFTELATIVTDTAGAQVDEQLADDDTEETFAGKD